MKKHIAVSIVILGMAVVGMEGAAVKPPHWLVSEAARAVPALPPETEAVILLDEQSTVVSPKGVMTTTCRRAAKILRQAGVESTRRLVLAESYDTKVQSMTGWVINPSGSPRQVTIKDVISSSVAPDTLYMDVKLMMLLVPEADVGSVVGFEWKEERTPQDLEDIDEFQGEFPVLKARYSLTILAPWDPNFQWVHWSPLEPLSDPSDRRTFSFEILDIPAVDSEPFRPTARALAGRLLVRFKTRDDAFRSFSGWPDMGAWYTELSRAQRAPDDTVKFKAREITQGSADTLSKIRALAEFVQREIRYVSIQIGIGGFQPHSASSILCNRYGDCKDKATLLAAMLQAIGVDSYYIIINTDRGAVTPESPVSLRSFNHAIVAIRLPDDVEGTELDSLVHHPRHGRLLVFDPTMPTTPLGRLPYYLQANTGLLVAGGSGELISLPRPGPEGNVLDRKGRLTLAADGSLTGEIVETRRGAAADGLRARMQAATEAGRRKYIETFLSKSLTSFTLKTCEFKDLADARGDLVVSYSFAASSYAKRAAGYLIVRPRVVGIDAVDLAPEGKKPRRYPVDLETTARARDEFTLELPEGFAVEDLPKPLDLDAGFASYRSRAEVNGRSLTYTREFRLVEPFLPVPRFAEALKFYRAVGAEEQQSLLLRSGAARRP